MDLVVSDVHAAPVLAKSTAPVGTSTLAALLLQDSEHPSAHKQRSSPCRKLTLESQLFSKL